MTDNATLAADIANVEAVRAVKRLQHAWGHYADAGDFAAMADLFAREGRLELPPREAVGREAIHSLLVKVTGEGSDRLNVRLMLSPVVSIAADGASAKGRWHEVAMTGVEGVSAHWSGGIHENDYVREDGVWKIATLRYHPQYAGDYAEGWRNLSDAVPLVPYHFTPDSAGVPVPLEPASSLLPGEGRGPVPATSDCQADIDKTSQLDPGLRRGASEGPASLSARARALADESLIHNLHAAYGQYLDRKLWDDVADLFSEDGTLEIGGEAWTGPAGIRAGLERFGPAGLRHGEFFDHLQLMPVVTLAPDGESATSRAIELQTVATHGARGEWGIAVCEASFRQRDGVWRIAAMRFTQRLRADYADGWGQGTPFLPVPAVGFAHPVREPHAPPLPREGDAAAALAVARAFDGAENVACAYGYFLDEAHWDETADLFSIDGWKELSFIGTYIGRERVRGSIVARYGRNPRRPTFLAIHQKTQPYVTVAPDGQSAQIRIKMFQINSAWEAEGSTIAGLYEEQVILEDGIWRIHGMDLEYIVLANYSAGWAGVEPGLSRKFAPTPEAIAAFEPAPDAPLRGLAFAPYPEIGPLGFHFANPVSGREPALRFHWSDGRFG